mgnify:CR=1 FL=1
MKIKVIYSELKSTGSFNNIKAGAEIEIETDRNNLNDDFKRCWQKVKNEVKRQLNEPIDDDLPF